MILVNGVYKLTRLRTGAYNINSVVLTFKATAKHGYFFHFIKRKARVWCSRSYVNMETSASVNPPLNNSSNGFDTPNHLTLPLGSGRILKNRTDNFKAETCAECLIGVGAGP